MIDHSELHCLWHGLVTKRVCGSKNSFTDKGSVGSHSHGRISETRMKEAPKSKSYFTCFVIPEILPKVIFLKIKTLLNKCTRNKFDSFPALLCSGLVTDKGAERVINVNVDVR